jgi:hypothetical protein
MMRRLMLLLVLLLTGFKAQATADAQPVGEPIFTGRGIQINSLHWWNNQLYFTALDGGDPANAWVTYQYDLQTKQVSSKPVFPWLVDLTPEQQKHYHAAYPNAFISPDRQTIVYISQFDSYNGRIHNPLFAIGEYQEHFDRRAWYSPLHTGALASGDFLRWSDNSEAFVVEYESPYGAGSSFSHIKLLDSNHPLGETHETWVGWIGGFPSTSIFDISPDGNLVLYLSYGDKLLLWDARIPILNDDVDTQRAAKAIADAKTIGAAFIPDDENHILLVDEQGISRYNINTHTREIINANINSSWAYWASFSPDNRYVALLAECSTCSYEEDVYVLPVNASE